MPDLEQSIEIDAPAELVYELISDLRRMPEWSPECKSVTWVHGGPAVGGRFVGRNRNGWKQWVTQGVVTAAEPGRLFRFDIHAGPMPVARWEYAVEPRPGGCTLTERFTDRRPGPFRRVGDRVIGPRSAINAVGIEATLAAVKQTAEGL